MDFDALQQAKIAVRNLTNRIGIDTEAQADDYPHFYYLDGQVDKGWTTLAIRGAEAKNFLQTALTSDVNGLRIGEQQATWMLEKDGSPMTRGVVEATVNGYQLHIENNSGRAAAWLRALSDGFVIIDPGDPYAKVPGPVDVQVVGAANTSQFKVDIKEDWALGRLTGYDPKPYFIGMNGQHHHGRTSAPMPTEIFKWEEPKLDGLLKTTLHPLHKELGAKMVEFAGYDMPVWYTSVTEEHLAVRNGSGIFDVTHMGVFEAKLPDEAS